MTMPSPGARGLTSRSSRGTRAEHHRPSRVDAPRFLLCLVLGCVACAPAGEQPRRAPSPPLDTSACDDACVRQRQREVLAALDDGEVDRARTLYAALPPPEDATGDWAHLVEARIVSPRATAPPRSSTRPSSPTRAHRPRRHRGRDSSASAPAQASSHATAHGSISAPAAAFGARGGPTAQGQLGRPPAPSSEGSHARGSSGAPRAPRGHPRRAGRQREAIDLYAQPLPTRAIQRPSIEGSPGSPAPCATTRSPSHAESAVRLGGPAAPESYRVLADVHAAAGDTQQAAAVLEQGRRRFPGDQGWTR